MWGRKGNVVGLGGGNELPLLKGWLFDVGLGKSLLWALIFLCCSLSELKHVPHQGLSCYNSITSA